MSVCKDVELAPRPIPVKPENTHKCLLRPDSPTPSLQSFGRGDIVSDPISISMSSAAYPCPALQQSSALCSIHLGRPILVLRTRILPAMAAPKPASLSISSARMAGFATTSVYRIFAWEFAMEQRLIAYEYDSDKSQLYLNNYERHFRYIADHDIKLLELGIHKGGSLLLWRDFFLNGKIVGLDLEHFNIDDPTGRIHIYQGDQRDTNLLDRISTECASDGFDIIIDDASHIAEFTKISFWHLFDNYLKPGGIYVIEDWRVGYWEAWPDGAKYQPPNSTQAWPDRLFRKSKHKSLFPSHNYGMVGLAKQLMDELGIDAITNPARSGLSQQRFPKFQRMEVCPGQVFIVKATKQDDKLVEDQLHGQPKPD